jgi:hypothetical protein
VHAPEVQPGVVAFFTCVLQLTRLRQLVPQAAVAFKFASQPFDAVESQLPKPPLQVNVHCDPLQPMLVAFCTEVLQLLPQPPQFAVEVVVLVSQPFDAVESQLPKPPLQVNVHCDAAQPMPVAFCTEVLQLLPQPPQFAVEVVVLVSQPFAAIVSQLAKLLLQVNVHCDAAQPMPVAFCTDVLQLLLQAPQSALVSVVFVSQPFTGLPSQSPNPPLHDGTQPPVVPLKLQLNVPFGFMHEVVQLPQCIGIVRSTRHPLCGLPAHTACVESHCGWQMPPAQPVRVAPVSWHMTPQPPQSFGSLFLLTSQPSLPRPLQSAKPALQLITQPPVVPLKVHEAVPLMLAQLLLHAPQWAVVLIAVSQPLSTLPSQSACVESHTGLHTLATQLLVPPAAVQTVPHAPQLLESLVVSTHAPEPNAPPLQ